MKRSIAAAALVMIAAIWSLAAAQSPGAVSPLQLVRCAPAVELACLRTRVPLDARSGNLVAQLDSSAERRAWAGDLGGRLLIGPAVVTSREVVPPLRLLVLLDRSGSMRGDGIAFTRLALRDFIRQLDSSSVRVAVAGFESQQVAAGISAAQFAAPAAAVAQLSRLPTPDPRANTALYSAIVAASARVTAAVRESPGTQGAILLVTDGRNEVGFPRDDPGLLAGASGLTTAREAIAASHQQIWIMGVGHGIAADTLGMLVGTNGSVTVANLEPNVMAARLDAVARELHGARDLTFAMPAGNEASLARTAWHGSASVWINGRPVVTRELSWRPPLFAMPAYQGTADADAFTVALRDALGAGSGLAGWRWPLVLFLTLMGIAAGILIPRLIWIRSAVAAPVPEAPRPTVAGKETAPAAEVVPAWAPGDLRRDVLEVAPRTAADITQQSARRS